MGVFVVICVVLLVTYAFALYFALSAVPAGVEKHLLAAERKHAGDVNGFFEAAKAEKGESKEALEFAKTIASGSLGLLAAFLPLSGVIFILRQAVPELWFKNHLGTVIVTVLVSGAIMIGLQAAVNEIVRRTTERLNERIEKAMKTGKAKP